MLSSILEAVANNYAVLIVIGNNGMKCWWLLVPLVLNGCLVCWWRAWLWWGVGVGYSHK